MGNGKTYSASILLRLVLIVVAIHNTKAALKTTFIEDLCEWQSSYSLGLRWQPTGILMSLPKNGLTESFDCEVVLLPPRGSSVVLSIYGYDVGPDDLLTIEDSDRFKVGLTGYGNFKDEKKAFISEGKMVIRYRKNTTDTSNSRQGFQFTFTAAQTKTPCYDNEFRCRNNLCILKEYVCDGHNHCGDGSDQKKCVPKTELIDTPKNSDNSYRGYANSNVIWISIIGVAGTIVFIIVAVFIGVVVHRSKAKKGNAPLSPENNNQNSGGNAPLQSVSSTVPQQSPAHTTDTTPSAPPAPEHETFSFYNRVRRSLRGLKNPRTEVLPKETIPSEVYQVPSMYPNLDQQEPGASEVGIENPEFKIDE